MDKIKKEVAKKMSEDQKDPDVHRYIVDNGVVKIKQHLEKFKKESLELKLDEKKDWRRREKILRETIDGVKVLLFILSSTTDDDVIRFRQCDEVFTIVFEIGKATCTITCIISTHLSMRFSPDNKKFCCGLLEIPVIFDQVLAYLTPEKSTDLSDAATIDGVVQNEMILCRAKLHEDCIKFNIFVSKKVRTVLKIMELSQFRTREGFKPFLSNVVKEFYFLQRACGLAREILKCTSDEDWSSHTFEYKKMFKCLKRLLSYGSKALRSLSFDELSWVEFKMIDRVCKQITQCKQSLTAYKYLQSIDKPSSGTCIMVNPVRKQIEQDKQSLTNSRHMESDSRSYETLNPLLKEIEIVCFKIGETVEFGTKCLPPGEIQLEEDVSVCFSSDFEGFIKENDTNGKGNDCTEESANDSDDGDVNDSDFEGSLTKIPPEEIEEVLKSSEIDRSEIINTYKMEGFESPVDIRVENKYAFTCRGVGGKVFKGGRWYSTKNVAVEGSQVSMKIEPGKYLLVHYDFPTYEVTFSNEDVKRGIAMSIPEANCSIKLPSSDAGAVTINFKVHLTDKERIKKYQEENPNKYGNVTISEGLQTRAKSGQVTEGIVEFAEVDEPEKSIFVRMSTDTQFRNWNRDIVEPEIKRGKLVFNVMLNIDVPFYIVQIKDENLKPRIKDPNNKQSVLKTVQNLFHTLLGFKSKCKLLTLYKVPEEMGGIIELCVLCIESKGFDLSKQAKKFFKKKWMQIEDGDKSTDFTIRSGEEICLEFRGNVKAIEGQSSVIKFLKNGSNFAHVKLRSLSNKDPNGYILMVRKDNLLDWKRLDSGYLVEKYEAGDKVRKMGMQKEKLTSTLQNDPQHILNSIFTKLSADDKQQLKQVLQMTAQKQEVQFMERFIARIQQQKKPLEFLAGVLRIIGQDNLLWNQLESMTS